VPTHYLSIDFTGEINLYNVFLRVQTMLFAVDIVVSFNGRRMAIDDDSSGATKYGAKML
jgi:hypothetical protein